MGIGWKTCILAAAALAALPACNPTLQGNGVLAEETRTVGPFTGVHVQDGVAAHVTVSTGSAQSVRVVGDANIVPHIVTETEPEQVSSTATVQALNVRVDGSYQPTIAWAVVVTMPSLVLVKANDASPVDVKYAATPSMRVDAGGRSAVTLDGSGGAFLDVHLSDASLYARGYRVDAAWVDLSGGSRAMLQSSGPVAGTAGGSSFVDNMFGVGPCFVVTSGSARTACH
jgi:hypothetical protein